MKHIFYKLSNIATGIVLSSFLVFSSVPVMAKPAKKQVERKISIVPEVSYTGTDKDGATMIRVFFETPAPVKFEVFVTDADGYEIFSQDFEASRFAKTFKLLNTEAGSAVDLTFSIRVVNGETHTYHVSTNYEQINKVSVARN